MSRLQAFTFLNINLITRGGGIRKIRLLANIDISDTKAMFVI